MSIKKATPPEKWKTRIIQTYFIFMYKTTIFSKKLKYFKNS